MRTAMEVTCAHGEPRGPKACAICRHAGIAGRDVGTGRVDRADPEWAEAARQAIRRLAATGRPFTAEDVVAVVGHPDRPNAIGAAMLKAAKLGLIYKVGMTKTTRGSSHARALPVWQGSRAPEEDFEKEWWQ